MHVLSLDSQLIFIRGAIDSGPDFFDGARSQHKEGARWALCICTGRFDYIATSETCMRRLFITSDSDAEIPSNAFGPNPRVLRGVGHLESGRTLLMLSRTMLRRSFLAVLAAIANASIFRRRGGRLSGLSSVLGTPAGVHFPKIAVRTVGSPLPD